MAGLTLKEILLREDIQTEIQANCFKNINDTKADVREILSKEVLAKDKENFISLVIRLKGREYDFENTLHIEKNKELHLLETRVFAKDNGQMEGVYLGILNKDGSISEEYIDDVWTFGEWEIA